MRAPVSMPRSPTSTTRCKPKRWRILSTWGGDRLGVAGGAFEYLDRDGDAVGGAQQAEHDLQGAALAVAAVTTLRQRAAVSLEVTGSQVVQHEGVVVQMALCQALLDTALAAHQPVHRGVQLVFIDSPQVQHLAESGDGALRGEGAGGGELGAGVDDAGDDQGKDQVAQAAVGASDESMQVELLEGAEDGGDVAVRGAAQAGEGGFGIDQGLALEGSADRIDDVVWEVRDVAEGFVFDFAVLAEGTAEEMGVVGFVVVAASGGGYVDWAISGRHRRQYKKYGQISQEKRSILVATHCAFLGSFIGPDYRYRNELGRNFPSGTSA